MQKILSLTICFIFFGQAFSQSANRIISPNEQLSYHAIDQQRRKAIAENGTPVFLNAINIKAISNFKKHYSNIDNETWQIQKSGSFIATFKQDSVDYIISYDKRGRWESTLKGYKEEKIPFDIRHMIKSKYYDFSINYINEIETPYNIGNPSFMVYIRFKNMSKVILVKDGEMETWFDAKNN